MTELDELEITADLFLNKTSILYGASCSGKSKFIEDILHKLRHLVKQIVVVCTSEPTNHTYGGTDSSPGIVPKPLIHYKLTDEIIIKIWKRQEMLASMYSRANDPVILENLFNRLGMRDVNRILARADAAKAEQVVTVTEQYVDKAVQKKKIAEIEEQFTEFKLLIYKRYIIANASTLSKMELSIEERHALKYIGLNPNMVLILDDCSADFNNLQTKEAQTALSNMFFRGRHVFLTTIIALHDDTMLDVELRKNAFISIFTTKQSAFAYLDRRNNGLKSMQKKVTASFESTFVGFQKLAYIRQHEKFYRTTASDHAGEPFTFGANSIINYCNTIKSTGVINVDKTNEFYDYFS